MKALSFASLALGILFGIVTVYLTFFQCYVFYIPMNNTSNSSIKICGLTNYADFAKNVNVVTNRPLNNSYAGELISYSGNLGTILNEIPKTEAPGKPFMDDYNSNSLIRNVFAFLSIGLGIAFGLLNKGKRQTNLV